MNIRIFTKISCLLLFLVAGITTVFAQLSAPGSDFSEQTQYPVFQETDNIFVFCTNKDMADGRLSVVTSLQGTKTFEWQKYNQQTSAFEFYFSESTDALSSEISNLEDACYKVDVKQGATTETYRGWVMNNWIEPEASVGESNCLFFQLDGTFTSAELKYYDLSDNSEITLLKDLEVEWKQGSDFVASINSPQVFDPPALDTEYEYIVSDRFGCEASIKITYVSIVTEASFTITIPDPTFGFNEAPLEVIFTNTSVNGDADKYEWFFFRDIFDIKRDGENGVSPIDSIMEMAFNESPIFTYENTGEYMVKLVSKKKSEFHTCTDTFYLENSIVVDSSFVQVPNVFTPNGDGVNDEFIVQFVSMQEIKIQLFNRWGRVVHTWDNNNIQGFEDTYTQSIWDGKIGSKYASPGVYYYMIEGVGRDYKKRRAHGFFHLFREKN